MNSLRHLLWPFAQLYSFGAAYRNRLFDNGQKESKSYSIPIIAVGNLSTGGTGKTPMVEFLANHLQGKSAIISRGYGRKTKGLLEVKPNGTADKFGDEPLQMANNLRNSRVIVSEKRTLGIEYALSSKPNYILLDDAFQHRYVKAGFYILLSSYKKPFYKDFVLPQGNLRESRYGAKRADCIVITKCPTTISKKEQEKIKTAISSYSKAPVYFAFESYGELKAFSGNEKPKSNVTLLTGIANPSSFIKHLEKTHRVSKHFKFSDHHNYTKQEIENIAKWLSKSKSSLVTTQKDLMRLLPFMALLSENNIYTLPLQTSLSELMADKFLTQLQTFISTNKGL